MLTRNDPFSVATPPDDEIVLAAIAASPPPPKGGLKKISFGAIAKKEPDTKTAYPAFPDGNGQAAIIAARIIQRQDEFEALEGALKTDKAELRCMVTPHYFNVNHARAEVPSSIAVHSEAGEVLVTFQNRYSEAREAALEPILGERLSAFFRQSFEIKINGDKLPEDQTQNLLDELQQLFARFNATEALEVKDRIKPAADFHAKRHVALTVSENLQLDEACPVICQIKTKGRK